MLLACAVAVQVVRDRGWAPYQPVNPLLWVQPGPVMNRVALGYRNLLADVYWMRAVVYYGEKRRSPDIANRNFDALNPLLRLVTSLDPHFRIAYRFGAIFLTEAYPQGPGRPDQAIQLLQEGIARDGGRWEYFHDIGFIYYWWLHDYPKAAEWFMKGAERPGAAEWLKPLAATTLASGGQRDTSRQLWTELLKSDMEFVHGQAEFRLKQLDALDAISALDGVLQRFVAREHRVPGSIEELAAAEHLTGVPLDPSGEPYTINSQTGRIDLSTRSPLRPLPVEAEAARPQ